MSDLKEDEVPLENKEIELKDITKRTKPYFHGHRARLRYKASLTLDTFHNYELLEILLFSFIPRKDVKPIAKDILYMFNDSLNLMCEYRKNINQFKNQSHNNAATAIIKIIGAAYFCFFDDLTEKPGVQFLSPMEIITYLIGNFYNQSFDHVKQIQKPNDEYNYSILFLNKKQILVSREDCEKFNEHKIIKKAILEGIACLIIVRYLNKNFSLKITEDQKKQDVTDTKVSDELHEYILELIKSQNHIMVEDNKKGSEISVVKTCHAKQNYTAQSQDSFLGFILMEDKSDNQIEAEIKVLEKNISNLYYKCMAANIKLLDYLIVNNRNVVSLKLRGII